MASAQRIDLRLVDAVSGAPVVGALVRIVRTDGVSEPERLSNAAGRASLATAPGVVRLLVRRIGFKPFTSNALTLAGNEIRPLQLALPAVRIALPTVAVTEQARDCAEGTGQLAESDLWQSIGAALAASQLTSNDTSVHTSIETFERDLDPLGHVQSQSHRPLGVTGARPFDTPPPDVLSRDGYVVIHGADANYYAPDARVLLSPEFANDHCFGIVAGTGPRAGLIGASFSPVRGRRTADVRGTLWVDTATAELRVLEYQYVNDGRLAKIDSLGGRLSFERLPSGDWIVDHWEIRMPTFRNGMWNGYHVVGSDAKLATLSLATNGASSIVGTVYDSVHAEPLAGARVALLGRWNATISDSSGWFRLDSVEPGPAVVTAQHALLDTLGLQGIALSVAVDSGAEVNVALATPSYATLWHRACGRGWNPPTAPDTGFAYGTVTDALTGARLAGASVAVAWIDPHWNPEDTTRARAWRVVAKTDSIGTYAVCGLPTDVPARVNAFIAERTTDRLDLDFAGRRMMRRDLSIGPADTAARGAGPHGVVVGLVRDSTGRPYPDARVLVTGAPEVRTDPDGRFVIRAALPGTRELQARAIGAAPLLLPIDVPANDTTVADVTLEHVTVLSTVEVNELRTTARRVAEYSRRRQLGIGYAVDSTEMQGRASLAAVFFNFPATRVQFLHGLDISVWFNNPKGGFCQGTVWIDGRKADFEEFNFYRPADLAAVEVFPSGAQLPGEFRSFDDLCGAIVVWTKNAFR